MGARTRFKLRGKSRRIELAQCNPVHLAPTQCHVLSPSGWGSLVWNKETVTGTWIACANRLLAWRTSSKKPPRQLKAARDRYQYLLAVTPGVDSNGPPLRDFRHLVD
jgi:hypothetical protein